MELPDFAFGISSTLPSRTSAGAARLAISFPTWKDATYQLRRATDLAGPFLPVLFSITPDGSLNLTALTGIGEPQTAYVDASGPRAFFRLELLISELSEPS